MITSEHCFIAEFNSTRQFPNRFLTVSGKWGLFTFLRNQLRICWLEIVQQLNVFQGHWTFIMLLSQLKRPVEFHKSYIQIYRHRSELLIRLRVLLRENIEGVWKSSRSASLKSTKWDRLQAELPDAERSMLPYSVEYTCKLAKKHSRSETVYPTFNVGLPAKESTQMVNLL